MPQGVHISGSAVLAGRSKRYWTQAELAAKAGVSISLLQRLEKGTGSVITAKNARKLADALEVTVDDLLAHASPRAGLWPVLGPLRVLAVQLLGTEDPELLEVASMLCLLTLSPADCRQLVTTIRGMAADELADLAADAAQGKLLDRIRPKPGRHHQPKAWVGQ